MKFLSRIISPVVIFIISIQFIFAIPPEAFSFHTSSVHAYYLFESVTIDGINIDSNDWVGAFNGDICVGARLWDTSMCGSGVCDLPIMGLYF